MRYFKTMKDATLAKWDFAVQSGKSDVSLRVPCKSEAEWKKGVQHLIDNKVLDAGMELFVHPEMYQDLQRMLDVDMNATGGGLKLPL